MKKYILTVLQTNLVTFASVTFTVQYAAPRTRLPVGVPVDVGEGETVQCADECEGGHPELVVRVHQEVGEVGAEQHNPVHRINVCLNKD